MKHPVPLFCIVVSCALSITGMERRDNPPKQIPGKLIAQSKNGNLGIMRFPNNTKPFSLYKVTTNGKGKALYSEVCIDPIGSTVALHTTRGIFISTLGFAVFDTSDEIQILSSSHDQYDTIFSDPGALNSLRTNLQYEMPTDRTALIRSCHGAHLYDIVTNKQLCFLPPYVLPVNKKPLTFAPLFCNAGKSIHKIPYDFVIYVAARRALIGFCNPINRKYPSICITTKKDTIVSEQFSDIEHVEYAKAHETKSLCAFGNGDVLVIDHPTIRLAILSEKLGLKKNMHISAIDFIPNTDNLVVALTSALDKQEASRIVVISSKAVAQYLLETPLEYWGVTRIDADLSGKTATLWTEDRHGTADITDADAAQDRQ